MTQDGKIECGDIVFYFASVEEQLELSGKPLVAICIRRPTTQNVARLFLIDDDGTTSPTGNVSKAQSLEECIEDGAKWASKDQLLGWGVLLHDGDQVLSEIEPL